MSALPEVRGRGLPRNLDYPHQNRKVFPRKRQNILEENVEKEGHMWDFEKVFQKNCQYNYPNLRVVKYWKISKKIIRFDVGSLHWFKSVYIFVSICAKIKKFTRWQITWGQINTVFPVWLNDPPPDKFQITPTWYKEGPTPQCQHCLKWEKLICAVSWSRLGTVNQVRDRLRTFNQVRDTCDHSKPPLNPLSINQL